MWPFARKKQSRHSFDEVVGWLIESLTPTTESVSKWLKVCEAAANRRSSIEGAVCSVFCIHAAVMGGTEREDVRQAVLPKIHERFCSLFAVNGVVLDELVALMMLRLEQYGACLNKNDDNWQLTLGQTIYRNITDSEGLAGNHIACGIAALGEINAFGKLTKETVLKYLEPAESE